MTKKNEKNKVTSGTNGGEDIDLQEKNSLLLYLTEINRISLMDKDEEELTAKKAVQGDKAAKEKLINANLRFVVMIAKKYQGRGMPLEDLIGEGNIGLLNAIKHYDAGRGFRFITYAVWWIRQSIVKALNEKKRMIRLPNNKTIELRKIEKTRQEIQNEPGWNQEKEIQNAAIYLKMNPDKAADLINISQDVISLDEPVSKFENMLTIKDLIEDKYHVSPEKNALNSIVKDEVEDAIKMLGKREAAIIRSRFGLDGTNTMTLKEIGDSFNLSREWIRQIEKRALVQLQHLPCSSRLASYIAS